MPYKSASQRRLMQAAAHNPRVARKTGVSQRVAKKFVAHEKGRKK